MADLVPGCFNVPEVLDHPDFRLRMLSASDVAADFEAVMESATRLRAGSPHGWPRAGFTLTENLADLSRHENEFRDRTAFAYTMVTPSDDRVLGCVYINPSASHDADVYMWVRDASHDALCSELFESVDAWLAQCWPFASINYIRQSYYR